MNNRATRSAPSHKTGPRPARYRIQRGLLKSLLFAHPEIDHEFDPADVEMPRDHLNGILQVGYGDVREGMKSSGTHGLFLER
jgi:hypothetical protein